MILNLNVLLHDLEDVVGFLITDVDTWTDDIYKQLGTTGSGIYELGSHETLSKRPECFGFKVLLEKCADGSHKLYGYEYVGRC